MTSLQSNGTLDTLVGVATSIGSRKAVTGKSVSEDSIFVSPETGVFAVADGLGGEGHNGGQYASKEAIAAVERIAVWVAQKPQDYFDNELNRHELKRHMENEILQANERIYELSHDEDHPERQGMNSTLELAVIAGGHLFHVHVGDSQLYKVRIADKSDAQELKDNEQGITQSGTLSLNPQLVAQEESLLNQVKEFTDAQFNNVITALKRNGGMLQGVHYTELQRMRRGFVDSLDAELYRHSSKMVRALGMDKSFDVTCTVTPHDSDLVIRSDGSAFLGIYDIQLALGQVTWDLYKKMKKLGIDYTVQPQVVADTIHTAANTPYDPQKGGVGEAAWINFQSLKRRELLIQEYQRPVDMLERRYGKKFVDMSRPEIVTWAKQSEQAQKMLETEYGKLFEDMQPHQIHKWISDTPSIFARMEREYGKPLEQLDEIAITDWLRSNGHDPDTAVIDQINEGIEQQWLEEFHKLQGKDDISVIYVRANLARPTHIGKTLHWRGNDKLDVDYGGNTHNQLPRTVYDLQAAQAENRVLRSLLEQHGNKPDLLLAMDDEIQTLADRAEKLDGAIAAKSDELGALKHSSEAAAKEVVTQVQDLTRELALAQDEVSKLRMARKDEQSVGKFWDWYQADYKTALQAIKSLQQTVAELTGASEGGERTEKIQVVHQVPARLYEDLGEALTTATTVDRIIEIRDNYQTAGHSDTAGVFAAIALLRENYLREQSELSGNVEDLEAEKKAEQDKGQAHHQFLGVLATHLTQRTSAADLQKEAEAYKKRGQHNHSIVLKTLVASYQEAEREKQEHGRQCEQETTQGYDQLLRTAILPLLTVFSEERARKDGRTPKQLIEYLRQESVGWGSEMPLAEPFLNNLANLMEAHYTLTEQLQSSQAELDGVRGENGRSQDYLEAQVAEFEDFVNNLAVVFEKDTTPAAITEIAELYETAGRDEYAKVFRSAIQYREGMDNQQAQFQEQRDTIDLLSSDKNALIGVIMYLAHDGVFEDPTVLQQIIDDYAQETEGVPSKNQDLGVPMLITALIDRLTEHVGYVRSLEEKVERVTEDTPSMYERNSLYAVLESCVEAGYLTKKDLAGIALKQARTAAESETPSAALVAYDIYSWAAPENPWGPIGVAKMHMKQQEYQAAIERGSKAIELAEASDNKNALKTAHLLQAKAYQALGENNAAKASYENYLEHDPSNAHVQKLLQNLE